MDDKKFKKKLFFEAKFDIFSCIFRFIMFVDECIMPSKAITSH